LSRRFFAGQLAARKIPAWNPGRAKFANFNFQSQLICRSSSRVLPRSGPQGCDPARRAPGA
jgi:hypothetical protein